MPAEPSVDLIPPLSQLVALAGPFAAAGGPSPLRAELALQLLGLAKHLVHLLALIRGHHLAVESQPLTGYLQVGQRLCRVVLLQRPPRKPDGVAGRGQL